MKRAKPSPKTQSIEVLHPADGDFEREVAKVAVNPRVNAASTLLRWKALDQEVNLNKLIAELERQSSLATSGNLDGLEAMLVSQAHTLDALFNSLAKKAKSAEYLSQLEAYLRLGLKAQGQCRATIEVLAAIKNPAPVAFVRQANISHGPQQVNNASATVEPSRARETEKVPNKLLERQYEEWLDGAALQTTVGSNSSLDALEAIHRTKDGRGQS